MSKVAAGGHGHEPKSKRELLWLSMGALGVVYGDIGTSPLYAMGECLTGDLTLKPHAVTPTEIGNVFGVLSLFFWALLLVVCIKYLVFVLRADNKGEGGILALAALVQQNEGRAVRRAKLSVTILLALFGAGLLYGDGVITPAISVLGAVKGLTTLNSGLGDLIVPISVGILIALFWVQRYGTHKIGAIFGWVMLLWFIAIAVAGAPYIFAHPDVLRAISPTYAVAFMQHHGMHGFLLLGSVVLCVTGGEALYADMGHFGKKPIRIAWSFIVFPGLLFNYFGQGALFLEKGALVKDPFYDLVAGGPFLIPMIILATLAAIIASQALISGAFSLTNQAVQLGFMPRVTVVHTSHKAEGQIYIPEVNWLLMVACVVLVLAFRDADNLAAAYGIAVTGTMGITSYLYFLVCRQNWKYSWGAALALFIPFIAIDLSFFSANVVKIAAGGWFPLAVGAGVFRDHDDVVARSPRAVPDDGERLAARRDVPRGHRHPGAATRVGHGGVHGERHRRHAERPAPPRQAQQGAPQAGRPAVDHHRERAVHRRRSRADGSRARPRLLPRGRARRLHAAAERPEDPRPLHEDGRDRERGRHHLLPRSADAAHDRQVQGGALAQAAVRVPREEQQAADQLLQPSAEPRRRARSPDRAVTRRDRAALDRRRPLVLARRRSHP